MATEVNSNLKSNSQGQQSLAPDRFPMSVMTLATTDEHPIHSFCLNKPGHGDQGPVIRRRLAHVYLLPQHRLSKNRPELSQPCSVDKFVPEEKSELLRSDFHDSALGGNC
jgi:hypothetical protein